ncbi:MAG: CoA-binding protein [Flavobacteriales bacterium]
MSKTLVIGASQKPDRHSNIAIKMLKNRSIETYAYGSKRGETHGVEIKNTQDLIKDLDTVTVYLSAKNQEGVKQYIMELHPKRVIFNPGAENEEFEVELAANGIKTLNACTLVLLTTGQY